jgi:hypothetical protein
VAKTVSTWEEYLREYLPEDYQKEILGKDPERLAREVIQNALKEILGG